MPPLISVGMPVYNEEKFLAQALHSLLAQDYANLEIIISDNASSDETENICREFAARDARIKYHRLSSNCGVAKNFQNVLKLAQGEYFMWASGHDLWSPNLISECINILEGDTNAILAFGSSSWIDATGADFSKSWGWTDTRGMDTIARFFSVFWGNMNPILGVMRTDPLKTSKGIMINTAGADLIVLSELALQGDFVHAPTASWSRREFRQGEDFKQRMKRYRSDQFGITKTLAGKLFPLARLPFELIRVIVSAEIGWFEKLGILIILVPGLPIKYFSARQRKA
jgi:glycosyltransferase involved in cell wall biosynthesis